MLKQVISFVCLILLTAGGGGCKKQAGTPAPKTPAAGLKPTKIVFEPYSVNKAPQKVRAAATKNRTRETASLLEDGGRFWVLLTRGEKPTGGYSVEVAAVHLEFLNGSTRLKVSYRYVDPGPGQIVTQVLTYPMELVLLKDLPQKPDGVVFELVGYPPPLLNTNKKSNNN